MIQSKRLTMEQRKEIFFDLASAQDAGNMSVAESRQAIMKQHSLTDSQLRQIEEEGVEKEWPPLN